MNERTFLIMNMMENVNWLSSVGELNSSYLPNVSDWKSAIIYCSDEKWSSIRLETTGDLTKTLTQNARQRYRNWNEIASEVIAKTTKIMKVNIQPIISENNLPAKIIRAIEWDIIHIAMSAEYADVFKPTFYADLALWYIKGHFPCGWEGDYPDGKLIVF